MGQFVIYWKSNHLPFSIPQGYTIMNRTWLGESPYTQINFSFSPFLFGKSLQNDHAWRQLTAPKGNSPSSLLTQSSPGEKMQAQKSRCSLFADKNLWWAPEELMVVRESLLPSVTSSVTSHCVLCLFLSPIFSSEEALGREVGSSGLPQFAFCCYDRIPESRQFLRKKVFRPGSSRLGDFLSTRSCKPTSSWL